MRGSRLDGRNLALAVALGLSALLAGCASDPSRAVPGASLEQTLQQLGAPTARYPLPGGGTRLQYSRQPMGWQVNNVDLGADGRVLSTVQALQEGRYGEVIRPDVWRQADVLREFGPPALTSRVGSFDGLVWTWRYQMLNSPRLLHLFIDPQGVVRRYELADEYFLEPDF